MAAALRFGARFFFQLTPMSTTPGPYHLSGSSVVTNEEIVCIFPDTPNKEANMQAVAAMPELIAALKSIVNYELDTHDRRRAFPNYTYSVASAALRRAGL